jgi:hypothetical protein
MFESPAVAQSWNPATDGGRAALDAMITTLAVIPLLVVFKQARGGGEDHPVVAE